MRSELFLQTPSWFILLCVLAGVAYATLLYRNETSWGRKVNYGLAGLRGMGVSIICFLLLSPLVRKTETTVDKAKVVFAVDNSESMKSYAGGLQKQLAGAVETLTNAGYEVSVQKLNDAGRPSLSAASILFDQKKTDLSGLLRSVKTNFEGRNLTDVILLSDGIVNQGMSPAFTQYPFKVSALAFGDTVPKLDIRIKDVVHNRIAYLGNDFPIRVEIVANGLAGKTTTVSLKQGGRVVNSQQVVINNNNYFGVFEFTTSSQAKGVQHFSVELGAVQGENSARNNRRDIYIDMIDGRQRILLLAYSPHPDIKALRSLIESNDNYELDVNVLTVSANSNPSFPKPYDLVILHQIPNVAGFGNGQVRKFIEANTPLFFILGNQSAVPLVGSQSKILAINTSRGQVDKVVARYNPSFQLLNFSEESMQLLERLPPLSVPFGEYSVSPGTESILYQRVGRLNTTKPLLALNTSGDHKTAVLAGEGIWQWRQEEFALTAKQDVVDNLFQKVIQILSIRNDKRKFRVYPIRSEFEAGEQAVLQTEIYNDIYEPIFGQEVRLELTSEKGKKSLYTYTHTSGNQRFGISGLSEGVYRFQASTDLRSGVETVSGQFVIRDVDIEMNHTTADFAMLRELASKTGGSFILPTSLQDFVTSLAEGKPANRLDSSEEMVELIHLKWIFFLLVVLMGLEWGVRKYLGGY
jgi:hypothetical protein